KWIKERSEGVQKDLGFKAVAGNTTKIPVHVMTNLKSPYGSVSQQNVSPQVVKINAIKNVSKENDKISTQSDESVLFKGPNEEAKETITNSAAILKGKWATLSAVVVAIVFAL
ncbi:hypothetical protein BGZ65_010929, partial [Modicella reniformis]